MEESARGSRGELTTRDGLPLFCQAWEPPGGVRGVVAVVHGYGDHSGRYGFLLDALLPHGYAVAAYDLRGHGRSPGRRGHVARFDQYLEDTAAFLAGVRLRWSSAPLVLLGHSMGGLIAAAVAERGGLDLTGLVLSSPFLRLRLPVSPLVLSLARVVSRLAPSAPVKNTLTADLLTHDTEVIAATSADPLVHRKATARWATETLRAQRDTLAGAGGLRHPLLLLYADTDPVVDPRAALELFERAASHDKTKICYCGYFHEIFNEMGREAVFDDLRRWLEDRLPDGAPAAGIVGECGCGAP